MLNKKHIVYIWLFFSLCITALSSYAQPDDDFGQTIQIYTRFHSFLGKPSWLLIIRDLDHDQNLPYLFDVKRGDNFWVAFTYSRNYLITVSSLQIESYKPRMNGYAKYKTRDFCGLESNGRIIRGESMYITINGDLSPNSNSYTCHVSRYSDANFTIVPKES